MEKKSKLLLADDSTLVRNNLKRLLGQSEYLEVYESKDVSSTKLQVKKLKPDIILLDLKMPGGSGLDVLRYLKKGTFSSTVIVLTNFPTEDNRARCIQSGAKYFFDKSKEYKQAVELVKSFLKTPDNKRKHKNGKK